MPKIVDHNDQRTRIADAACRAIARRGVDKVTMIDMANEAGVTTGMILNYYKNKDQIITAALQISFQKIEMGIESLIEEGGHDLADLLEPAIPVHSQASPEITAWVSFWGLIATDDRFRQINESLHREGARLYQKAMDRAWPSSARWSVSTRDTVLRAIATMLFGLSAGGVTNPSSWSGAVQKEQLRLHLALLKDWAEAQPS